MLNKRKWTTILLLLFFLFTSIFTFGKPASADASLGSFAVKKLLLKDEMVLDSLIVNEEYLFVLTNESKLYQFQISRNEWKEIQLSSIKKANALASLSKNELMIIGGQANSSYSENMIYHIHTGKFTKAASFPYHIENRPELNAVTLKNGNVLVIGSYMLYSTAQPLIFEYDAIKKEWTTPYKANKTAYALEISASGNVLNYGAGLDQAFVTGLLYDAAKGEFYETSSVPSILSFPATAALAEQFLLAGGNQSVGGAIYPSNQAYLFDSSKNSWKSISAMKEARVNANAVALSNRYALVIGGFDQKAKALQSTELYDVKSNTWTKGPALNYAYMQPQAHLLSNGKLLVVGATSAEGRSAIAVEVLNVQERFLQGDSKHTEDNQTQLATPSYPGILMSKEQLFVEDGWSYHIQYRYVPNSRAVFSSDQFEYTRMYLVRQKIGSAQNETLLEGIFSFLRKDGNELYLIESGQLKKMKIGSTYSEAIVYPKSFKKEDPTDSRYHLLGNWDLYEGKPITINSYHFDGEYIYTWWSSGQYKGFPIKIHYTGSHFRILGKELATDSYSQLLLEGKNLYYTTGASFNKASKLVWSTVDGKTEKVIATITGGVTIFENRIYYKDANDLVRNGHGTGKLYSMKLDGTDKRKHNDNGAGVLYKTKHGLIYNTYHTGSIMQLSEKTNKTIVAATSSTHYSIIEVNDHFVLYSAYHPTTMANKGTYKYSFADGRSSPYKNITENIDVLLNGKKLAFSEPPILKNNTVMVPFRVILEELGTKVSFDSTTKSVTATKQNTTVVIKNNAVSVNGSNKKLNQAPFIQNGTTYVPLRFMSEVFGADVQWVSDLQVVVIHMK